MGQDGEKAARQRFFFVIDRPAVLLRMCCVVGVGVKQDQYSQTACAFRGALQLCDADLISCTAAPGGAQWSQDKAAGGNPGFTQQWAIVSDIQVGREVCVHVCTYACVCVCVCVCVRVCVCVCFAHELTCGPRCQMWCLH